MQINKFTCIIIIVFDETIEVGRKDYKTRAKYNYAVWQCK